MNLKDFLGYQCYAYNRSKNPEFLPEKYAELFENWKEFEKQYQKEKVYWDSKAEDLI